VRTGSSGLGYDPLAVPYEQGNELSGPLKITEFLEHLSDH
jgi:hypothetical protein